MYGLYLICPGEPTAEVELSEDVELLSFTPWALKRDPGTQFVIARDDGIVIAAENPTTREFVWIDEDLEPTDD